MSYINQYMIYKEQYSQHGAQAHVSNKVEHAEIMRRMKFLAFSC